MNLINFSKSATALILMLITMFAASVFGQNKDLPVTKERLVTALRTKAVQTSQIVDQINLRGVNFQMTAAIESELVAAGARPQVIEAARNNYRAEAVVKTPPKKPTVSTNAANAPVTKDRLLKSLRSKALSNGTMIDLIEKNGVNFETTSTVEKELAAAGASPALIAAVKSAYQGSGNRAEVETNYTAPKGGNSNSYDSLVESALDAYNRDVNSNMPAGSAGRLQAIQTLNKAVDLQPNNPIAYQQLGFMTLYGTSNGFTAAEANFKKAIELGGSAVFRVYHDHDGFFQDSCNGSLYVSKDKVRFESDDNKHTFDVSDADIKNVKTNSSFMKAFQTKPGSYKIVLKNGEGSKNYNFAPLTENNEESKMVVKLIGK